MPQRTVDNNVRLSSMSAAKEQTVAPALILLTALGFTALGVACTSQARDADAAHLVERARLAMGSELRLSAWTTAEAPAVAAFDAVFAEFDRLEALMSVWRAGSDI